MYTSLINYQKHIGCVNGGKPIQIELVSSCGEIFTSYVLVTPHCRKYTYKCFESGYPIPCRVIGCCLKLLPIWELVGSSNKPMGVELFISPCSPKCLCALGSLFLHASTVPLLRFFSRGGNGGTQANC